MQAQMSYSAGIAQATGTRLDSAAKHTMPCKIDTNMILSWMTNQSNSRLTLHQNKYKYCMQKDELILNVTQRLNSEGNVARGYPAILSSLCDLHPDIKNYLFALYSCQSGASFMYLKNNAANIFNHNAKEGYLEDARTFLKLETADMEGKYKSNFIATMERLPYFTAQGYGLGTAWASEISGDTVGTVLVGGMVTVRNGAFPCRAGQVVQWYFDEEHVNFSKQLQTIRHKLILPGERTVSFDGDENKVQNGDASQDNPARKRKTQQEKTYDTVGLGRHEVKTGIALPKPYVLMQGQDVFGDKIRIFAKCMNGGRPFDQIDLMLMTQSL